MMGTSALRRIGKVYYRDAGHWDVEFKRNRQGDLIVNEPDPKSQMHHVHGKLLTECTEAEWRISNGQWAPLGSKAEQELAYLRWCYAAANFDADVLRKVNQEFTAQTGKQIPQGY